MVSPLRSLGLFWLSLILLLMVENIASLAPMLGIVFWKRSSLKKSRLLVLEGRSIVVGRIPRCGVAALTGYTEYLTQSEGDTDLRMQRSNNSGLCSASL